MVDERIEERIRDVLKIYLSKMDSRDFYTQGMNYIKTLSQDISSQIQSDDPDSMMKTVDLYIWIKMTLLSSDISEDMLNSKIDRLLETINNS